MAALRAVQPALFVQPAPAVPVRAGLSLVDRMEEVDVILTTLESLEDSENSEGFRIELQEQLIVAITGTRDKIDRCGAALSALIASADAAQKEIERQAKRKAQFLSRAASLEGYMLAVLTASKLEKLDGNTVTFSKRKNPPAVAVDDETQIPADYMRTPEPPPPPVAVPDKARICAALKADAASVPGCRLTQGERLVRS